jgi:asparagine synthetase B (glutamine-hydrolysing)
MAAEFSLKKVKKAHKAAKEEIAMRIITSSRIKEYYKEHDLRCPPEALEAVAAEVYALLNRSVKRCLSNDRKTIRKYDVR